MLSIVEPRMVMREAPPVAGVRREFTLILGGKAPRLGGFRAELGAAAENAAPIFEVPRAEPDPSKDSAPRVAGVAREKEDAPRRNLAAIAISASVLAHVLILAWAFHAMRPDEALAKGGDLSPIVIEGISVELVDQVPSPLREAQAVEETADAREVVEEPAVKAEEPASAVVPETENAAVTPADVVAPVADAAETSHEAAIALAAPDVAAKPVEDAAAVESNTEQATAVDVSPEAETAAAVADDAAAIPAAPDSSSDMAAVESEGATTAATATDAAATAAASDATTDATVKPVEPDTAQAIEAPEVLAKDIPETTAPATDLYRDTIATADETSEHAALAEDAVKAEPPKVEVADDAVKIAPLEETADPVDAPQEKDAPPKPKKVAAVTSAPSKPQKESRADTAAQAPLFGIAGAGGRSDVERGKANSSSYRAQVAAHLRRYRSYPDAARGDGISGTARVYFVVNADGRVTSARLTRSSGHAVLDRAAVEMVRRASPVPPIPANLALKTQSFDLPVRFDGR